LFLAAEKVVAHPTVGASYCETPHFIYWQVCEKERRNFPESLLCRNKGWFQNFKGIPLLLNLLEDVT
jgi:hypothetical protein